MKSHSLICVVCGVAQNRSRLVEVFTAILLVMFFGYPKMSESLSERDRPALFFMFVIVFLILMFLLKVAIQTRSLCVSCHKSGLIPIQSPIGRDMMENQQARTEMAIQDTERGKNSVVERDNRFRLTSRTL